MIFTAGELLTQKNRVIKIRIGKPISVKEQNGFIELAELSNYLRKKTYMLANPFEKEFKYLDTIKFKRSKIPNKIISPVSAIEIEKEIEVLNNNNSLLFSTRNYKIYLADTKAIKNILLEFGRLREITFREVGEGTNKALDLDKFDDFYKHLFLWDNENKKIH